MSAEYANGQYEQEMYPRTTHWSSIPIQPKLEARTS